MSAIAFIACFLVFLVAYLTRNVLFYGVVINLLALTVVALDKFKSTYQLFRIRETDFYVIFLFGGWVGGIVGMLLLRHKTRKVSFLVSAAVASVVSILVSVRVLGWT